MSLDLEAGPLQQPMIGEWQQVAGYRAVEVPIHERKPGPGFRMGDGLL